MTAAEQFLPLSMPGPGNFVGRERELVYLREGLIRATGGIGQVFLLVGEPGIGKTRLATEIGAEATRAGAMVLWGRCSDDVGAPPYWPWAQILRRLVESDPESAPIQEVLGQIVPQLYQRGMAAEAMQPGARRFELFDAVERLLGAAARRRPLVLIFDDLHAADLSSLQLLQFVARQVQDAPILIVGNYRAADLERDADRAQAVDQVVRSGTRIPLSALSSEQVTSFVRSALGDSIPVPLLESIYGVTEGHPLFVTEMVQLLLSERDTIGTLPSSISRARVPRGVREIIHERIRPLSGACRQLLREAAVLGRRFDTNVLKAISSLDVGEFPDLLGEAERAGILGRGDESNHSWHFAHDLIRDTLYGSWPEAERVTTHRRIAEALEASGMVGSELPVAEIAHHYAQAAAGGGAEKAIDYSMRAGQQALRQWAYEDATECFAQALRVLDHTPDVDPWRRCEILLAQGMAQRAAGSRTARATFESAAELGRELCAIEPSRGGSLFAKAVLGVADQGLGLLQFSPDAKALALLEEAAESLPSPEGRLHVQVLARLAAHLSFPENRERSLSLIEQATTRARELGDAESLAMALAQHHFVLWRFNVIDGRIDIASELIDLADRSDDHDLSFQGRAWRLVDLMTAGDAAEIDRELRILGERAEGIHQPRYRWMVASFRTARALWRGHWAEALALADEVFELGVELGDAMAAFSATFQKFLVRRETGSEESGDEARLQMFTLQFPESPMPRALWVQWLFDHDRLDEASAALDAIALGEFATVRRDRRLGVLALLVESCAHLEASSHAPALLALLEPFADYNVMYAAMACFGSAARYLGTLHGLCGNWEEARALLERGLARNQAMGAAAQVAWTQHDLARMWLRRSRDPSSTVPLEACLRQARRWIATSRSMAAALSMVRLQASLTRLASELEAIGSPAEPANRKVGSSVQQGIFYREGEQWLVSDGEEVVRVADMKGLHYIAELMRCSGQEIHALDLCALADAGANSATVVSAGDEPLLDPRARSDYRARLAELRGEIDEAESDHDVGRLEFLRLEEQQIQQELARAVGLRGRNRPSGSAVEKARLNVTRAIHTAVRKIRNANPKLGQYFSGTIKTGNLCAFHPDPRAAIDWTLDKDPSRRP